MSVRPLLAGAIWLLATRAYAQIPAPVAAELARAQVPPQAVAMLVSELGADNAPLLNHRSASPMQAASVMKLVTTFAALDTLGPAFTWSTPVYLDGTRQAAAQARPGKPGPKDRADDGLFQGDVYIQGQGDPKLVAERLWLLLRRLQGLGIAHISGDIVIDRSAFELPPADPSRFDGEPLRPYNAAPDAFLVNYGALGFTFTPDPAAGLAFIQTDLPLAGIQMPAQVALAGGPCADYRSALAADFSDPLHPRFNGRYPGACAERTWSVAPAEPAQFAARAVQGMWSSLGGQLGGTVRYGNTPPAVLAHGPAFVLKSPPLGEVVRDINKFSNNVMAQQLYLTLGRSVPSCPAIGSEAISSGIYGEA